MAPCGMLRYLAVVALWSLAKCSRIRVSAPAIVPDPEINDSILNLEQYLNSLILKEQPATPLKESTVRDFSSVSQIFESGFANIETKAICTSCKILIGLMVLQIRQHQDSDSVVEQKLRHICPLFSVATTEAACVGLLERLVPTAAYIFRNRRELEVEAFCGFTLQQLGCNTDDPYLEWDLDVRDLPKRQITNLQTADIQDGGMVGGSSKAGQGGSRSKRQNGGRPVKILQLADLHIDPRYTYEAPAECDNNILCCQNDSKVGDRQEYIPAGYYADSHKCDPPMSLLELTLQHLVEEHGDIEMFYMTGDIVPHNIHYSTIEENTAIVQEASALIYKYFPTTTVITMVGNHEPHPVNFFSPPDVPENINTRFIYDVTYDSWKQWIPVDQNRTYFIEGYYVKEMSERFKIVALNTNVCYGFNFWGMYDVKDPGGQLAWLIEELEKSEAKQQKVHIVGHVPPGHPDCNKVWSRNFYNVISRYHRTVTAQFYGHTHYDELKLFHSPTELGKPINVLWISPSLTAYELNNPSYKLFYADGGDSPSATWDIVDYETWVFNLDEANQGPQPSLKWFPLYRATTAYGIPDTRLENMGKLVSELAKNKTTFNTFYRYYRKALPEQHKPNNSTYKRKQILCNIVIPYFRKEEECLRIQREVDGIVVPIPVLSIF